MNGRRVGIFQYEWPLQVHTLNLIDKLVEAGYYVDFFYKSLDGTREHENLTGSNLRQNTSITYYDYSIKNKTTVGFCDPLIKWLSYLPRRCICLLGGMIFMDKGGVIDGRIFANSLRACSCWEYRCLIGVEKKGLIWAGMLANEFKIPHLYYSLELYTEEHPEFYHFRGPVSEEEKKYHRLARATIIQDEMRAKILFESNGVNRQDVINIPVSVRGEENRNRDAFFSKYISTSSKILLYFGLIHEFRLCNELAAISQALDDDYAIVLHGYGDAKYVDALRKKGSKRLLISVELVSEDRIKEIIASAYIGLVLYRDNCANNRLTAFASEKLALYLQSGVPFIALDNESYRTLIDDFACGELISDISEIPQAARRIESNYDKYRENAYRAYSKHYNYDNQFNKIEQYLSRL